MKVMTRVFLILVLMLFAACSIPKFEGFSKNQPLRLDKSLPKPKNIQFISDSNSIAFEWQRVNDPRVIGYAIYRSDKPGNLRQLTIVKPRFATHFVDFDLKPNITYNYKFASIAKDNFQSESSKLVKVKTKDFLEPLSFIKGISNLPKMTKILFRPHSNPSVNRYIIQRKDPTSEWENIATIKGRLQAEYIDEGLEDNKVYQYRIFAKTYDNLNTHISKTVRVKTKALPNNLQNIKASVDKAKLISISWKKIKNDKNFTYNIYVAPSTDGNFRLLKKLKSKNNFDHSIKDDGIIRFYKVTITDEDGLESSKNILAVQGATKEKPNPPMIISADFEGQYPIIRFDVDTEDIKYFKIIRSQKSGLFKNQYKIFRNVKTKTFIDRSKDLQEGVKYLYEVIAINKDNIASMPSEAIALVKLKAKE